MDFKVFYPAVFHPEDEGYSVSVPDFENAGYGCYTQGNDFEDAYNMAIDAVGICVEDMIQNKIQFPEASKPEDLVTENRDFVVPILFDLNRYYQKNKNRAVKKTLTIPEWLNELAEENNINFSKVLRIAVANELGITLN